VPRRSRVRQRALIALAGSGLLIGYLLASGAAAPLVSDVLTAATSATGDDASAATASADTGRTVNGKHVTLSDSTTDWMSNDQRPEWGVQRLVPQGPTGEDAAQGPISPVAPRIQVPENPKGRSLFTRAAPMRRYTLQQPGDCAQPHGPGLINIGVTAVATKAGTASVSWWDLGDPDTKSYQVDAIPLDATPVNNMRPKVVSQTIAAPASCRTVTMSFPGLISGVRYFFGLTAWEALKEQPTPLARVGRGQSQNVTIT
jgi:hypothetical protein